MALAGEKGVSSWLTTSPSAKQTVTVFYKSDFRDAVAIRYGLPLDGLPTTCVCGACRDDHRPCFYMPVWWIPHQVAQVVTSSVRSVAREPVTILAVHVSQNESSVCVCVCVCVCAS